MLYGQLDSGVYHLNRLVESFPMEGGPKDGMSIGDSSPSSQERRDVGILEGEDLLEEEQTARRLAECMHQHALLRWREPVDVLDVEV
jgi:hypothetical protein